MASALKTEIAKLAYNGMSDTLIASTIEALIVTGTVPTSFPITGAQLFTLMNWAEFAALTVPQQTTIWNIMHLAAQGALIGGPGTVIATAYVSIFPVAGPTIASLTAFAKGITQTWRQAHPEYTSPLNAADIANARAEV